MVTGEKWGSLFLSKPGFEIRSKRDVFSYIGSKTARIGVPIPPLVGSIIQGTLILSLVISEMGRVLSALRGCFEE